jgi:hypothetical protein
MEGGATGRAYLIAGMGGIILWAATAFLGGRSEPWDSGLYWSVGYPLALVAAAALGYAFPNRPWRWALLLVYSQLLVLLVSGSGFGMLPLALILLAFLCLPAVALARFGAFARGRTG